MTTLTEGQQILMAFKARKFDEVEAMINKLSTNPNSIFVKKNYGIHGPPCLTKGEPLFNVIAYNVKYLGRMTQIYNKDKMYQQFCRILRKLKEKGANLELMNSTGHTCTGSGEHTRILNVCITQTANNIPNYFIEFLLELGANPNNYTNYTLLQHVASGLGEYNYDLMVILLKYGLDINKLTSSKKPMKFYFLKDWESKTSYYRKHPEWIAKGQIPEEVKRILKIKELFDEGVANHLARLERERLEKERLEKERLEKERLEKERLAKLEAERKEKERLAKLEAERKEKERLAKLEAERQERERLAKIEAERLEAERQERERLAKIEAEKHEKERQELEERKALEEFHKKQDQDQAFLMIMEANSSKCQDNYQYLPNNYLEYNINYLKEILQMINFPEELETSSIENRIKFFQEQLSREEEIGLDLESQNQMGGAYFLLAITNLKSLSQVKKHLSSHFLDYLSSFTDSLFRMANQNMNLESKKKVREELAPELKSYLVC